MPGISGSIAFLVEKVIMVKLGQPDIVSLSEPWDTIKNE